MPFICSVAAHRKHSIETPCYEITMMKKKCLVQRSCKDREERKKLWQRSCTEKISTYSVAVKDTVPDERTGGGVAAHGTVALYLYT